MTPNAAAECLQPILTITTSKNWVLPPRPKNTRKAKAEKKKKTPPPKQRPCNAVTSLTSVDDLHLSIRTVDRENYQLKTRLLSLIHDYKSLRAQVLQANTDEPPLYDAETTARKRLYTELGDRPDPMHELILDMNELSYRSPALDLLADEQVETELFDFVNLDSDFDMDDELESQPLSRSISPSVSETDENLLMTSLTRSTTVSTTNSSHDRKVKMHDLPPFSEQDYAFSFEKIDPHDKMMAVIEEDHYNQVADFLEERLMSNDVKYYVETSLEPVK